MASGSAIASASTNLEIGGAGDTIVQDPIALIAGCLTKSGSGTLTLSAANTYTGVTTVAEGTLKYGIASALSYGPVTVAGGTWDLTNFADTVGTVILSNGTVRGVNGAGILTSPEYFVESGEAAANLAGPAVTTPLTKNGAGVVLLSKTNMYKGLTTVNDGTLRMGVTNALPYAAGASNLVINAPGALDLNSFSQIAGALIGDGTVDNSSDTGVGPYILVVGTNNQSATFSGLITNSAGMLGLSKWGTGTQTLSGANAFTGPLWVQQGRLSVEVLDDAHNGSGTIKLGNATVAGDLEYTGAADAALSRAIDLAGTTGGGTLTANGPGSLTVGAFSASGAGVKALTLQGTGWGTVSAAIVNGTANTMLAKAGEGTWVLTGENTYSGFTTNLAGVLQVGDGGSSGNLSTNAMANAARLVFNRADVFTNATLMSGTGSVAYAGAGTVRISKANTYTGLTTISNGVVKLGILNALPSAAGASNLVLNAPGLLDMNGFGQTIGALIGDGAVDNTSGAATYILSVGVNGQSGIFSGSITNSSGRIALNKIGAGTLTLGGANGYTGATTVSNGVLHVLGSLAGSPVSVTNSGALSGTGTLAGSVTNSLGGRLQPGVDATAGGVLSVGALTLNAASTNIFEFDTAVPTNDLIDVANVLTINGGVVYLRNEDGSDLDQGGVFRLIRYTGSILGAGVSTLSLGNPVSGRKYSFGAVDGYVVVIVSSDVTWDGDAAPGDVRWTTASNWVGDTAPDPAQGQTLVFSGSQGTVNVNDFPPASTFAGLVFDPEAAAFTLGGTSSVSLIGDVLNNSPSGQAIDLPVVLDVASRTFGALSNNLAVGGGIGETGAGLGIVKTGPYTLTLTNQSTFTGPAVVSAGAVNIRHAEALGSEAGGVTVSNGAALELQGGIAVGAEPATLNGMGVANGGALRNIAGDNSYAGTLTLGSAALIQSDAGTLTLDAASGSAITGASANVTFGGTGAVVVADAIGTAGGRLTKNDAGTLTLLGNNSYTGATAIAGGTVNVRHPQALGTVAGNTTVADGSALELQDDVKTLAEPLVLAGAGVGGGGALRSVSGANIYSGAVTLASAALIKAEAGTLTLDVASGSAIASTGTNVTFGGTGDVAVLDPIAIGSGTLTKNDSGILTLSGANTFTGVVAVNGGTLRATTSAQALGTGSASLTLEGGDLQLLNSTALAFGRNTTAHTNLAVLVDRLAAGAGVAHSLGTLRIAGSTLGVSAGPLSTSGAAGLNFGATTLAGDPVFSVATNGLAATLLTLGGLADGGVARTLAKIGPGTLALTGAAPALVDGTLARVAEGTLSSSNATALGSLATVDVADDATFLVGVGQTVGAVSSTNGTSGTASILLRAALTLGGANDLSSTFPGVIGGTAPLIKAGAGTLTLSGTNTYSGLTYVSNGTVRVGAGGSTGNLSTNATANAGVLVFDRSDVYTNASLVSGTGSVTFAGSGTVRISKANTYTGLTTIDAGVLKLGVLNALPSAITSGGVSLNAPAVLDLNGFGQTIGALGGDGTVDNMSGGATYVLTVGTNGQTGVFNGAITNSSGKIALNKVGAGTLTLGGVNGYTGQTTVSNGTLNVANILGSATGPGPVSIFAGATLTGVGSCAGVVSNRNGATLAPGVANVAGGLLTVGGLALAAGGTGVFEFASAPAANDQVLVAASGGLTISGGDVVLLEAGTTNAWAVDGVYTLIRYTGALGGSPNNLQVRNPAPGKAYIFEAVAGSPNRIVVGVYSVKTWTGASAVDGNWSTDDNWTGGHPVATDLVAFAGTGGNWLTNNLNDLAAGTRLDGVVFGAGASPFTLSGNAITLHGNLFNHSVSTQTVALPLDLDAGSRTFNVASGSVQVAAAIGETNGTAGLLKEGAGTLALSAANTFGGGLTLSAGTLRLAHAGALGTGTLTIAGGSIDNASGSALALDGDIPQAWSGNFTFKGSADLDMGSGPVTLNNNVTLTATNGIAYGSKLTVGGVIDGPYRLTRAGNGVNDVVNAVVLGDANTFTGGFTMNGGALIVGTLADGGQPSSIGAGDSSPASFAVSGGWLTYAGPTASTDRGINLTGLLHVETLNAGTTLTISGDLPSTTGTLLTEGSGTIVLAGTNVWVGAMQVAGDYVTHQQRRSLAGRMQANGNLRGTSIMVSYGSALGGTGTVNVAQKVYFNTGNNFRPGTDGEAGGVITINNLWLTNSPNVYIEFDSATNDMIVVTTNLVVTPTVNVHLREEGTANPWTVNGDYRLIRCPTNAAGAAQFQNGGVQNLAVANPVTNTAYTFFVAGEWVCVSIDGPTGTRWDGGGADDSWSTSQNWDPDGPIASFDSLVFSGTTRLTPQNDYAPGALTNGGLWFLDTPSAAGAFTLGGSPLDLAGSVVNMSDSPQTIDMPLILRNRNRTINAAVGSLLLNGAVSDDGGGWGVTKTGTNTATLGGTNSYSGPTTISAGTLAITRDSGLGSSVSGTVVSAGGALELQGPLAVSAESLTLSGSGYNTNGALRSVLADSTYGGPITLAGPARIASEAGTLTLNSTDPITGAYSLTFAGAGTTLVANSINTGAGSLTNAGPGTVILATTNNYTGATVISGGGSLVYGCDNAIASGPITIGKAATLDIGAYTDTVGKVTLLGGRISGTGTITATAQYLVGTASATGVCDVVLAGDVGLYAQNSGYEGAGTVGKTILTALNTYTGATFVGTGGGILAVDHLADGGQPSGIGASTSWKSNLIFRGVFEYRGPSVTIDRDMVVGQATRIPGLAGNLVNDADEGVFVVTQPDTVLNLAGVIDSSNPGGAYHPASVLFLRGPGTVEMSGTNTYVGRTEVRGGTLRVTGSIAASNYFWTTWFPVQVASNATLSGGGVIHPAVRVQASGTLAPGSNDVVGLPLTVGGLILDPGCTNVYKFNAITNDTVVLEGTNGLTINGGTFFLYDGVTTNAWTNEGVYRLIQYPDGIQGSGIGSLSVANPSEQAVYSFGASDGWVTLTIGRGVVWDGGGDDDLWRNATNWTGDAAPVAGDGLTFAGTVRLAPQNDFAANTAFHGFRFSANAGPFVLGGNTVNLVGDVVNDSTNAQVVDVPLVLAGGADRYFTAAAADLVVSNVIGDAGAGLGIIKAGAHALVLTAANTYEGPTTVNAGSLRLGAADVIPDGAGKGDVEITAYGTLDLDGYDETINALTGSGTVTNSGALTATLTVGSGDASSTNAVRLRDGAGALALAKTGSGVLALALANSYSGGTAVDAGTLRLLNTNGSAAGSGTVSVSGGATLDGTGALDGAPLSLSGSATVSPGADGPGLLTVDDLAWQDGAVLLCRVTNVLGSAGIDYGDLVVNGALSPAVAGDKLTVRMDSMGQVLSYDTNQAVSLRVLTSLGDSIELGDFTLDTNDFLAEGPWALTNMGSSLYVYHAGAAQTSVWIGAGSWSDPANWAGGRIPQPGDEVLFDGTSPANCTAGFNSVNDPIGKLTLDAGYTGTVRFAAKAVSGGMVLAVTGDLTVNEGSLALAGDTSAVGGGTPSDPYGVGYTIRASNVTIAAGASLNADHEGFPALAGPGRANLYYLDVYYRTWGLPVQTNNAPSYGGYGGTMNSPTSPVPRYGTVAGPTALGSGGGNQAGGGALKLEVPGIVRVDGTLSASCTNAGYPAGSGGSIWIASGTLEGAGLIRANGGSSPTTYPRYDYMATVPGGTAGAGGGRIDISGAVNNFAGRLEVLGGLGYNGSGSQQNHSVRRGMPGTIRLPASGGTGLTLDSFVPYTNIAFGNPMAFGTVLITNGITVTIQAYSNETVLSADSLTVQSNGSLVCIGDYYAANEACGGTPDRPYGEGVTLAASTIAIEAGGRITANDKGFCSVKYADWTGPGGAGVYNVTPAAHGGQPGGSSSYAANFDINQRARPYGRAAGPTALGSGGNQHDQNGGGAIKLEASGTITIDGTLSADSTLAPQNAYVAGAGGSIWIASGTLQGSGRISANGGTGGTGTGGGGGGRIDISGTTNSFIGLIQAAGGVGGTAVTRGHAGSLLLPATAGSSPTMASFEPYGTSFAFGNSATFGTCVVSNGVVLTLDANEGSNVFTFTSLTIQSGGVVRCMGNLLGVNAAAGGVTNDIRGEGVTIAASSLTIAAGGLLTAEGRGFDSSVFAAAHPANPGGHAGYAGNMRGAWYGALSNVTALGTGTNLAGGGAIRLVVSGILSHDGTISCNANTSTSNVEGASGGSIWIDCGTLQGSGRISADGSVAQATTGRGGSGGRIHILADSLASPNPVLHGTVTAYGGATNWYADRKGAAGTILVTDRSSSPAKERLYVVNSLAHPDSVGSTYTPIPTNAALTSLEGLYIGSYGSVRLLDGSALEVSGVFSNGGAFIALPDSAVSLVGSGDALVYGNNQFQSLAIGSAAPKTVSFQPGRTNAVARDLILENATLVSQATGSWWYVSLDPVTGSQSIRDVRVQDSHAGGGQTLRARGTGSESLGNNVNWTFPSRGSVWRVY